MSLLSRVAAPTATHSLADLVATLLSNLEGAPPKDLSRPVGDAPSASTTQPQASAVRRLAADPTGLGTSAARIIPSPVAGATAADDTWSVGLAWRQSPVAPRRRPVQQREQSVSGIPHEACLHGIPGPSVRQNQHEEFPR